MACYTIPEGKCWGKSRPENIQGCWASPICIKEYQKKGKHLVSDTFIIINPHMITGRDEKRQWFQHSKLLNDIVNEVVRNHSGDPDWIYLTGLSAGGHGSWGLAKLYPQKFAAIVPIAGRINFEKFLRKIGGRS